MDKQLQVIRILWSSLLFVSACFCAASCYPIQTWVGETHVAFAVAPALWAVAAVDAVISFLLPAQMLRRWAASVSGKITLEHDPDSERLFREAAPRIRVLRADPQTLRSLMAISQTRLILACAISESVALMGTALCGLGFWPVWSAPLGIAGLALVAIRMPSRRAIIQSASKALDAKLIVS